MHLRKLPFVGVLLLVVACWGCGPGGPELGAVEGTVTMDGKPLPNATVVFIPENGRTAGARTDANGHYVLNFTAGRQGAMLGKSSIRITTLSDPSETPDGKKIPGSPETIPMKYNSQSTLEFTVKADEPNVANFDLVSGGPISLKE